MARRKLKYQKAKRKMPEWTELRSKLLIFQNKLNFFDKSVRRKANIQNTNNWRKVRKLGLPASLIRRAVSGAD